MLNNQSILITGGTGSFGKEFVRTILDRYPDVRRLIIFSRDELKQFEMAQMYPSDAYPQLRFFLGDIRDLDRLRRALKEVDIVIHAAALKQVPAAEYNPFECIKTNVIGAQNLIEACLDSSVKKMITLSTDKAASPINLYGASKLCSDKLIVAANNMRGSRDILFSVVRYGNVMGSRGSVIPYFFNQAKNGVLTITDAEMTRFNISLSEGVEMVLWAIENALGGEIFVPKIPSYRITDLAKAVAPDCTYQIIGIRPGEKIHEEMITVHDSENTVDLGNYYAILPPGGSLSIQRYSELKGGKLVPKNFSYNSGENLCFLTVKELQKLISIHCPNI
jgi:UDP-N-acetylglucosamine 4,6-dehydratase/5-epimerase